MPPQQTQTDVITIMTPESVPITLELAGLGSRFIALIVDSLIIGVILLLVTFGGLGIASSIEGNETLYAIFAVLYIVGSFLLLFGYFVLFEVKNNGQTPGKKAASVRVIREDGQPVNFAAASIRAIVFILLDITLFGLPGMICIIVSKKNQRIGDIAAGTLVVRSRAAKSSALPPPAPPPATLTTGLENWDVSQVSDAQLAIIQDFLQRRIRLDVAARKRLATELTARISDQIHAPTASTDPERLLEQVYAAKSLAR